MVTVAPDSTVLDLGSGNGALTQALADRGYRAFGMDDSAEQVALARSLHPKLTFLVGKAVTFTLDTPV